MAVRTCLNCVYVHCDLCEWLRCHSRGEPLLPRCANHPQWPGELRDVPGTPCRNYQPKPPEPGGDVRRIPLGDGQHAIVNAADYEWLRQWTWHLHCGYAMRNEKHKNIYMHRQIMRPRPGMIVDHINHHRADNRRVNLRVCSSGDNSYNRSKRAGAVSRFKGVTWRRGKWFVKIVRRGVLMYSASFDDEVEAARAYDRKAVECFGLFACLNFPEEWPPERREKVYAEAQPLRDALTAKAAQAEAGKGKGRKAKSKKAKAPRLAQGRGDAESENPRRRHADRKEGR